MRARTFSLCLAAVGLAWTGAAQTVATGGAVTTTGTGPFVPGVTYQNFNPNYPKANPFFFEGKIDWEKLGITQPINAFEYTQQAIHKQDDLNDITGAIADYQTALTMSSIAGGTCQLVTSATFVNGALPAVLNPAPCMFTPRLRLAYLLRQQDPVTAAALYKEVLQIDPLRLDVNALLGEVYVIQAQAASTPDAQQAAYANAIAAFKAELVLSPVSALFTATTGDEANNAHVHWELAEVYQKLNRPADQMQELNLYLKATKWHSDTYPWRIQLAQTMIGQLAVRLAGQVPPQ